MPTSYTETKSKDPETGQYYEIPLSDKTLIKVSRDTVNEKTFGQIRIWTKIGEGESAKWIPTKKGVAFSLDKLEDIIRSLSMISIDDDAKKYAS